MKNNKSNGVKIVKLNAEQRRIADAGIKASIAEKEYKKSKHKIFRQDLDLDVGLKLAQMNGLTALGDFGYENKKMFPESTMLIDRIRWIQTQPKEYRELITSEISEIIKNV